jgi:hypothetical protein
MRPTFSAAIFDRTSLGMLSSVGNLAARQRLSAPRQAPEGKGKKRGDA